jgi:hypothetical protein
MAVRADPEPTAARLRTQCAHSPDRAASSSEFQTKILRKNLVPDEYRLYRAALEWDLTDPIVTETRKDLKSEKRWQERDIVKLSGGTTYRHP